MKGNKTFKNKIKKYTYPIDPALLFLASNPEIK